jgi:cellulose synthase/poly-beta-1,6-N-acetylglucosamine synthase-like glycosyltransferase
MALAEQTRAAEKVIIVVRHDDTVTIQAVQANNSKLPIEIVYVFEAGQVHALNAGLAQCDSDIVAITDDDAAPRQDWLARIEAHFSTTPELGCVGGRDWVHHNGLVDARSRHLVGRVQWFGRLVGNHHLGVGPARDVDFLKGANFAFRMAAIGSIGFNKKLRGFGAQLHNDMVACLAIKQLGWRVIYDPLVAVDHYPAARADEVRGSSETPGAISDRTYNYHIAIAMILPFWRRIMARLWHRCIGFRRYSGRHIMHAARTGRIAADKLR